MREVQKAAPAPTEVPKAPLVGVQMQQQARAHVMTAEAPLPSQAKVAAPLPKQVHPTGAQVQQGGMQRKEVPMQTRPLTWKEIFQLYGSGDSDDDYEDSDMFDFDPEEGSDLDELD